MFLRAQTLGVDKDAWMTSRVPRIGDGYPPAHFRCRIFGVEMLLPGSLRLLIREFKEKHMRPGTSMADYVERVIRTWPISDRAAVA